VDDGSVQDLAAARPYLRGMRSYITKAERERWIALVVLCTGFLMIILDGSIVNVALPSIQSDLGFSQLWCVAGPTTR
jgi:hypothetical protein